MKGSGGREVELKRHKHKIITNDVPPTRTRDRNTPSLSSASANTYFIPPPISPIFMLKVNLLRHISIFYSFLLHFSGLSDVFMCSLRRCDGVLLGTTLRAAPLAHSRFLHIPPLFFHVFSPFRRPF